MKYAQPQQYLPQQSPPQPQPLASEEQLYYQQQTQQQLSARSQPPPTPHSGRSPLPISRTAVRALNAPLPAQREQLILLRGGDSHPSSLISLWRSNSYSDVDVIVEGQAFYAHRLVLASGSEYLSALVENSPPLAMQGRRRAAVVELPGVSADAFEVLLEWLYCGEVGLAPSLLPPSSTPPFGSSSLRFSRPSREHSRTISRPRRAWSRGRRPSAKGWPLWRRRRRRSRCVSLTIWCILMRLPLCRRIVSVSCGPTPLCTALSHTHP